MSNRLSEEKANKLMQSLAQIAGIMILNPSKDVNEMIETLKRLAYAAHNKYYESTIRKEQR